MEQNSWEKHYMRKRSQLLYPDENLVRLIQKNIPADKRHTLTACDFGCGSGRHGILLQEMGFGLVLSTDISSKACHITYGLNIPVLECATEHIPFHRSSLELAVCWGSLHYGSAENTQNQIDEIYRVLQPGGMCMGTLRSSDDTFFNRIKQLDQNSYIVQTRDLEQSMVTFFSEEDMTSLFSFFSFMEFGIMTEPGQTGRISHYYFRAVK